MIAPLQLDDFETQVLAYERVEAESPPEDVDVGVAFGFEIDAEVDEERGNQRIRLLVSYNEEDVPDDVEPYIKHRGRLQVTGWLHWIDEEFADREDAERLLLTNGLTMLYGIARVRVADLTDESRTDGEDRLILPSVSFLPIVEDWLEEEQVSEDESESAEE